MSMINFQLYIKNATSIFNNSDHYDIAYKDELWNDDIISLFNKFALAINDEEVHFEIDWREMGRFAANYYAREMKYLREIELFEKQLESLKSNEEKEMLGWAYPENDNAHLNNYNESNTIVISGSFSGPFEYGDRVDKYLKYCIYQIFLALNLSLPGCICLNDTYFTLDSTDNMWHGDTEKYPITLIFPFDRMNHCCKKLKIMRVPLRETVQWLQPMPINNTASNRIQQCLYSLLHLCEGRVIYSLQNLIWISNLLESLYCKGECKKRDKTPTALILAQKIEGKLKVSLSEFIKDDLLWGGDEITSLCLGIKRELSQFQIEFDQDPISYLNKLIKMPTLYSYLGRKRTCFLPTPINWFVKNKLPRLELKKYKQMTPSEMQQIKAFNRALLDCFYPDRCPPSFITNLINFYNVRNKFAHGSSKVNHPLEVTIRDDEEILRKLLNNEASVP